MGRNKKGVIEKSDRNEVILTISISYVNALDCAACRWVLLVYVLAEDDCVCCFWAGFDCGESFQKHPEMKRWYF